MPAVAASDPVPIPEIGVPVSDVVGSVAVVDEIVVIVDRNVIVASPAGGLRTCEGTAFASFEKFPLISGFFESRLRRDRSVRCLTQVLVKANNNAYDFLCNFNCTTRCDLFFIPRGLKIK